MEYNKHKSVTIPNQVMPLRELLHRFTNGVPIGENLERQGSYDFSSPFTPSKMPTDCDFDIGHDANEIDITIAHAKAERGKSNFINQQKQKQQSSKSDKVEDNVSDSLNTASTTKVEE